MLFSHLTEQSAALKSPLSGNHHFIFLVCVLLQTVFRQREPHSITWLEVVTEGKISFSLAVFSFIFCEKKAIRRFPADGGNMTPLSFCSHQPSCRENVGAMTDSSLARFERAVGSSWKSQRPPECVRSSDTPTLDTRRCTCFSWDAWKPGALR